MEPKVMDGEKGNSIIIGHFYHRYLCKAFSLLSRCWLHVIFKDWITALIFALAAFPSASKLLPVHSSLRARPPTLVANTVSGAQRSVCTLQKVPRLHIWDHCLSCAAPVIHSQREWCGRQSLNLIFMTQFRSQNPSLSASRKGFCWSRLCRMFGGKKAVIGLICICSPMSIYFHHFYHDCFYRFLSSIRQEFCWHLKKKAIKITVWYKCQRGEKRKEGKKECNNLYNLKNRVSSPTAC